MARVFLTGATGFIGSRLLRRLLGEGAEVVILRRESSDTSQIEDMLSHERLSSCIGSVEDVEVMTRAMSGCTHVVHAAGDVSYWRRHARRQERINVGGTRNVLAAARAAGVERLLHTSSVAAVGIPERGDPPATEESPWNAPAVEVAYFQTKRAAEDLVRSAANEGMDAVIACPAYVIGPGDVRLEDGNVFIDMHEGTIPVCPSGGNCWVDVDDVVEGLLLVLAKGRSGERYILGGENLSYREAFEHVAGLLGVAPPSRDLTPLLAALGAPLHELLGALRNRYPRMTRETAFLFQRDLYFDSSRAREELGYTHRPFAETATRTIAWYRERGYLPPAQE